MIQQQTFKLDKKNLVCEMIEKDNKGIISRVKFYFEEMMKLSDVLVKGRLIIHDPNLVLHGKRVRLSSKNELPQYMYLSNLIVTKPHTLSTPELLVSNFLETMKPFSSNQFSTTKYSRGNAQ